MDDEGDKAAQRPAQGRPPPGTGRKGKPAFLAFKAEIERDLLSGIEMAAVYEKLRDRLPFSYSNFAKYVGRYLPGAVLRPGGEPVPAMVPAAPLAAIGPAPEPPKPLAGTTAAPAVPEPLQAPADDRPRRFTLERQSDDKLF